MPTAYLIAGWPSSGNRLLAAVLVRSGCAGEASTEQPDIDFIPPATRPLVVYQHWDVRAWIRALRRAGYERVVVIVIVREPVACVRSAIAHDHFQCPNFDRLWADRSRDITQHLFDAIVEGVIPEIVTYEGLTEPFLAAWLPRIGLPYVPGEIILPGQIASSSIESQNEKWYPR